MKTKVPKLFNLHLYYKQGTDLNEYLHKHKNTPDALTAWLTDLENEIKSVKKLVSKLDKKKVKCLADADDIALVTTDLETMELLNSHDLIIEDRITVDVVYEGNINTEIDDTLIKLAKKYEGNLIDAGYFFGNKKTIGQRNMTFDFDTQEDAILFEKAGKKLLK